MTVTTDEFLTAAEVARLLKIRDTQTVTNLCRDGKFSGAKNLGGRVGWRIPRAAVDKFMSDDGEGGAA